MAFLIVSASRNVGLMGNVLAISSSPINLSSLGWQMFPTVRMSASIHLIHRCLERFSDNPIRPARFFQWSGWSEFLVTGRNHISFP